MGALLKKGYISTHPFDSLTLLRYLYIDRTCAENEKCRLVSDFLLKIIVETKQIMFTVHDIFSFICIILVIIENFILQCSMKSIN